MRHQVSGRKLGKTSSHRKAMFRNMATSLIEHGRIKTTLHKAKELRSIADQLVTLGKRNTLHTRRQAFDLIRNKTIVKKLFDEIAPAFEDRKGGYTRIYHIGQRVGDAAKMAVIEFLQEDLLKSKVEGKVVEKKAKAKKEKKPATEKKAKKEAAPKKEAKAKKSATKAKKAPAKKKAAKKEK